MENEAGGAILAQAARDGFISAADRDRLAADLGPQGNTAFSSWLQQKGIKVQEQPVMDETDNEELAADQLAADDNAEEDLASLTVGNPQTFLREYQSSLAAAGRAAKTEAEARKRMYEQAQQQIEQSRFGVPSASERLYQIAAALSSPSKRPGFAGALNNLMPVLAQQSTATRTGAEQRAAALAKLQQDYQTATTSGARSAADARVAALAKVSGLFKPVAPPALKSVIVENGVAFDPTSGAKLTQPSDAAWAALASDASPETLENFVRTFGPRFEEQARRIVDYAMGGK